MKLKQIERWLEQTSARVLVLKPDFTIVAASEPYLRATLLWREPIKGCHLFEVFPARPNDPEANAIEPLRTSLEYVIRHNISHRMKIERYDVRDHISEHGKWVEKHWRAVNAPMCEEDGKEITHLVHVVNDVTQAVLLRRWIKEQSILVEEQRATLEQMLLDFNERQSALRAANEPLVAMDRGILPSGGDVEEIRFLLKAPESRLFRGGRNRALARPLFRVPPGSMRPCAEDNFRRSRRHFPSLFPMRHERSVPANDAVLKRPRASWEMTATDRKEIVVIGASAGGVISLTRLAKLLPQSLYAGFFIATHRSLPHSLTEILSDCARMPVHPAEDLLRFQMGHMYVCPADRHIYLENGILRVEDSPRELVFRPSINYLFRSAASVYGRRVIGVVLSGSMDDGTAGLWQIKKRGGVTIAQDPADARFATMPQSAIDNVAIDFVLDIENLAKKLIELTGNRNDESQSSGDRVGVLIVEDENVVANNLSQALIERGYVISGKVRSGEEAIEAVAKTNPRIVLMDIRLAGSLAGTEAAREIWERFQVPVIYLTAYADREIVNEVKTTENYGYVTKPFNSDQVHVAIELALDRREKELRVPPGDTRSSN